MNRIKLQWQNKPHKHWLIVAFLAIATFLLWRLIIWAAMDNTSTQTANTRFNATVSSDVQQLQRQLEVYSGSLYSARALFQVDKNVSRQDWTNFVDAQNIAQRFPGFYGIAYARVIEKSQIASLTAELNANRLPTEQTPVTVYPPSTSERLAVVSYLAPENINQKTIGYDLLTSPERAKSLDEARDSGTPQASVPLSLLGEDKSPAQPSVLLVMPIYGNGPTATVAERQAALTGYAVLAFHTNQLLESIFNTPSPYGSPAVTVSADGSDIYQTRLKPTSQALQKTVTLDFAGQPWKLTFGAPIDFGLSANTKLIPTLVLASTIPFAIVLYIAFFYFLRFKVLRQAASNDSEELKRKNS